MGHLSPLVLVTVLTLAVSPTPALTDPRRHTPTHGRLLPRAPPTRSATQDQSPPLTLQRAYRPSINPSVSACQLPAGALHAGERGDACSPTLMLLSSGEASAARRLPALAELAAVAGSGAAAGGGSTISGGHDAECAASARGVPPCPRRASPVGEPCGQAPGGRPRGQTLWASPPPREVPVTPRRAPPVSQCALSPKLAPGGTPSLSRKLPPDF